MTAGLGPVSVTINRRSSEMISCDRNWTCLDGEIGLQNRGAALLGQHQIPVIGQGFRNPMTDPPSAGAPFEIILSLF
jgi:hypothetical protein